MIITNNSVASVFSVADKYKSPIEMLICQQTCEIEKTSDDGESKAVNEEGGDEADGFEEHVHCQEEAKETGFEDQG